MLPCPVMRVTMVIALHSVRKGVPRESSATNWHPVRNRSGHFDRRVLFTVSLSE